jgi:hypothetical protein
MREADPLPAADDARRAQRMPTREGVVPLAEMKRAEREAGTKEG